ncbi:MAG: hypothetical protein O3A46_11495, partial [Candidatus Poribacteria bacterium]|nr:hypothetical protein [Candidatus Poribacteria bacterium]
EFFNVVLGSRRVGPRNLALLSFDRTSIPHWTSESLMPYVLQNFRLTSLHGLDRRKMRLAGWMIVAVLLAIGVSYVASLNMIYQRGGLNLEGWVYQGVGVNAINHPASEIQNLRSPSVLGLSSAGVGAGVMAFLLFMRHRFLWWPLHPIGYALGVTWAPFHLWFSTLVGWSLKLAILKFAGFGTYRRWRAFFLGLIVGEYLMVAILQLLGVKTGVGYWGLPH